jgi:hypothetical protein
VEAHLLWRDAPEGVVQRLDVQFGTLMALGEAEGLVLAIEIG